MFDCVGYVFGSGPVFCIDKKKKKKVKEKRKKKGEREEEAGQGNKKESSYICCFQFAALGTDTADSSDQWPPEN